MTNPKFLIVHISDLHFGPGVQNPDIHRVNRLLPQGMFGHDPAACDELETAISGILQDTRPDKVILVASGDLTVHGCNDEFCVALSFLRGRILESWRDTLGLLHITDSCLAVPGNHDHWRCNTASSVVNVQNSLIHGAYFPSLPTQTWWHKVEAHGPLQLQLMGIDTCAGSPAHAFAKGSVNSSDLADLETEIDDADAHATHLGQVIVRVLVLHHSLNAGGGLGGWAHALDPASVQAVKGFCARKRVASLLTGHVHLAEVPSATQAAPREFRCGTTLQGAPPRRLPTPRGQSFLAHFVEPSAGTYTWRTELYERQWTMYGAVDKGLHSSAFNRNPTASRVFTIP